MDHPLTGLAALAGIFLFALISFAVLIPAIDRWERANEYPFGMACDHYPFKLNTECIK